MFKRPNNLNKIVNDFNNIEDKILNIKKIWCVYIMTNKPNGIIYIGVTDNIEERVQEHKNKVYKNSFTARYNCDKLVYLEEYEKGIEAVNREKQLKKWNRQWKVNLIEEINLSWMDLSMNWKNEDLIYKSKRLAKG